MMDVAPVRAAVLSKRKDTGLYLELDWDERTGTEQLKDSMSPCFTTAEGSTDRTGGW